MKKIINWKGYIPCFTYIFIYILVNWVAFQIENGDTMNLVFFVSALYAAFLLWAIPYTLNRTWYKILPNKQAYARLIDRTVYRENLSDGNGSHTNYRYFLIFELEDGTRKVFSANRKNNTILLYEEGMLTYRERGRRIFLVSFERWK